MDKYDLIIVGGGALGTFHAYHALLAGLSVYQIEKDNFPVSATVRNFGQVVPSGMEGDWFSFGLDSTRIYKDVQKKHDISVRQNGSLYLASDEDELLLLNELKAHYDLIGYRSEMMSNKIVLQKYPSLNKEYVKEGLFFPEEISVEPDRMILSFQTFLKNTFNKYKISYNTAAIGFDISSSGVKVTMNSGAFFDAEKLIICNGYEFKLLLPAYFKDSGILVSKLQMLRTKAIPGIKLEGNILTGLTTRRYESFEHNCPSFKTVNTPDSYQELQKFGIHILFKQAVDGSFIIGDSHEYASVNEFDKLSFKNNQYINKLMLDEAQRIVTFDVNQVDETWCGFYPQHPDKHIVSENIEKRVYVRTAIGGKGMTASAGYASESLKQILK